MYISAPSYVIPGTYLENVRFISGIREIENVELFFFVFDAETENLLLKEIDSILSFNDRFGFTVHLPDIIESKHEKLIELTRDFTRHYVIHPPAGDIDTFLFLLDDWISRYGERFLLENLAEREWELLIRKRDRLKLCFDTGHLLLNNGNPGFFMKRYAGRIEEIHLHGVRDGWDHQSFRWDESWFQELSASLEGFAGVVNLEVFRYEQLQEIIDSLQHNGLIIKY
ncbi:MAG: cobamide remodeling phosphodiesterase CbiR [Spirochaetota bacterium]